MFKPDIQTYSVPRCACGVKCCIVSTDGPLCKTCYKRELSTGKEVKWALAPVNVVLTETELGY